MPQQPSFRSALPALLALLAGSLPPTAAALCTSDGVPQPVAVLERFTSADCEACWRVPATPGPGPDTLVLDWIVPGRRGEDAPLAVAALDEASERLRALGRKAPGRASAVSSRRTGSGLPLRLAQGEAFNDYIGASIELPAPGRGAWNGWLLLVEALPAGVGGSPVARNLVRNVFRPHWSDAKRPAGALMEARSLQIRDGTRPVRLRLAALLYDARGRLAAIVQTRCD